MNSAPYLPGKKIIFIGIAVLVAVTAISFWAHSRNKKVSKAETPISDLTTSTFGEEDADSDGLKDWEEDLWKTDRSVPDSDQDGTTDKDEIDAGRSPSLAGPNDKLPNAEDLSAALSASFGSTTALMSANLTKTDTLSRIIFGQAVAAQQNGGSFGPNMLNDISNLFSKTPGNQTFYTTNDITITATTDTALREYGNNIGQILVGTPTEETNELLVFAQFSQTKDQGALSKLSTVSESYQTIAEELTAISVPDDLADTHIAFINSLAVTGNAIGEMAVMATDPIAGVGALQQYVQTSEEMVALFSKIKNHLKTQGTYFAPNEPGYKVIADTDEA